MVSEATGTGERGRGKVGCVPHLVDVGGESEAEGVSGDRLASFEAGGTECEIHLDFVPVVAGSRRSSDVRAYIWASRCVLYLLEHVAHRDNYAGDGGSAKHTHDGNCRRIMSMIVWGTGMTHVLYCSGFQKGSTPMA